MSNLSGDLIDLNTNIVHRCALKDSKIKFDCVTLVLFQPFLFLRQNTLRIFRTFQGHPELDPWHSWLQRKVDRGGDCSNGLQRGDCTGEIFQNVVRTSVVETEQRENRGNSCGKDM